MLGAHPGWRGPHVTLRPLSYLIPQVELTASQWEAWVRKAASRRPARGLHTIWRGVLELLGRGKQGVLIEETVSMHMVRVLRGAMADHPVVVAAKRRRAQSQGQTRQADVRVLEAPAQASASSRVVLRLRLQNTGASAWRTDRMSAAAVRLGV